MNQHDSSTGGLQPKPGEPLVTMVKGLDSRLLRHLLAVVECKSFTLAAQALHITQPALTKSIQKLEHLLGVKLLERHRNMVEPTIYGQILTRRANLVELELAHAASEIQSLKGGHMGTVNIGIGPTFLNYLPKAVLALQQKRPNVRVRVLINPMNPLIGGLLSGDLDVICTAMEFPAYPDLEIVPLFEAEHVLIANAAHPLAGGTVEPSQLLAYPWITFSQDHIGASRIGSFFAANHLPPPNVAVTVSSLELMFAILRESDYLAAVPSPLVANAQATGLAELPIRSSMWRVQLCIAHRRTSHLTPSIRETIDTLRSVFASASNEQRPRR